MPPPPPPFFFSIVWCFLVRNADRYLDANANRLISVSERAAPLWGMQYLENDSTDANTRPILHRLELAHPGRVRGEMLNVSNNTSSLSLCHLRARQARNCRARTELLASFRQRLLVAALVRKPTLLVMVDIDFVSFDADALVRLFQLRATLDADGVFGVSVNKRRGTLYDTGSVEPQSALSLMVMRTKNHSRPIRVRSAFSGFGLYSAASIVAHNASYLAPFSTRLGRNGGGEIEHIRFNSRLTKLYVDVDFRPVYR